jgi:membrane associated rhomboid family serine protease
MPAPPTRIRLGPRLTPVVTWLIGINIATFLVFSLSGEAARNALIRWLLLTPGALAAGQVWKLVTTIFFNTDGLAFFLDVLVLWLFVPTLEAAWGRRRFLMFFGLTSLIGNVVAALLGLLIGMNAPIVGMGPFIYGAIAAFGVEWAEQPVQFFGVVPMKGKTMAIGVSVVMLLAVALNGDWLAGAAYVAAIATALVFAGSPRVWLLRFRRARQKWRMRKYTVLHGGRGRDGDKPRWLN